MRTYASVFRIRFIGGLQYRAAALAGVSTQFAWGFMELLAFRAFYGANAAAFPMAFEQLSSYIWLQQAFLALFMTWFWEGDIFSAISSGQIAYELARPMDLYGRWFAQATAGRVTRAALRCMPILLVAFFLPGGMRLSPPADWAAFGLFALSMALALCVVIAFQMLVYASTFYTLSPLGVRIVAAVLADFLAGAIIPLPFFPDAFQRIAEVLPFAAMQNVPLRIYVGHLSGAAAWQGVALQVFWLVALAGIGRLAFGRALRRVVVQGG